MPSHTRSEYINGVNHWVKKNDLEWVLRIEDEETIVDAKHVESLKKYKWHVHKSINPNNPKSAIRKYFSGGPSVKGCMHRYLMLLEYGQTHFESMIAAKMTVDHINRDSLDNHLSNLRWATITEQNKNKDKQVRPYNAQDLPLEIAHIIFPKYVSFAKKKVDGRIYDYFRIQHHPALNYWASVYSTNFSIKEKLDMTYAKLNELDPSTYHPCTGKTKEEYIAEQVEKDGQEILAEEDGFVLKRNMLPDMVFFEEQGNGRFSIKNNGLKRECTTQSKKVSLEAKYNDAIQRYERRKQETPPLTE